MKTITHPVYGAIDLDDFLMELLETPETQRLGDVYQLGPVRYVYPGATHTRLLHVLGTCHEAGRLATHFGLTEKERRLVQGGALMHDDGHFPYSHTLQGLVADHDGPRHEDISAWVVTGRRRMNLPKAGRIPAICRKYGVDADEVAALITKTYPGKKYLQDIISGTMDADRLDYLAIDAHYTGVQSTIIDQERILRVLVIEDGRVKVKAKGTQDVLHAMESRDHMTSHVYVHHAVRSCRAMLRKAAELCKPVIESIEAVHADRRVLPEFYSWTDSDLTVKLSQYGGKPTDLMRRLRFNRGEIYKTACQIMKGDSAGTAFQHPAAVEQALTRIARLKQGDVLVDHEDAPSEPDADDLQARGILIAQNGRDKSNYAVYGVYCAKENVERVREAVQDYISAVGKRGKI
ncbi:HD domain-containing protein [Candidatus Woesearchaeota archaeon]|nr:HD domain-containing protein [Candidatus Woesearchaeota archaeon]